jgi:hypothetical protein
MDLMTVFAIQQQMKFDDVQKKLVPRFSSIEKAFRWGKISYVLSPAAHPFNPELVLGDIHKSLCDFCDEDYLLLIGNPVIIGMSTSVAAHYNEGRVKFLQWSGRHGEYTEIPAKIY